MNKIRCHKGFTLLEVITVLVITAGVFLGFVIMLYDMSEQMHISWQLRDIEEFGHWYVNEFIEKMRNGTGHEITHITPPSEAHVTWMEPRYYALPGSQRVDEEWEFEFDQTAGLPIIRIDNQKFFYEYWPPRDPNPRDTYFVDPESFVIEPTQLHRLGEDQRAFTDYFLTIRFSITYQHESSIPGRGVYEKKLDFEGSAYIINERWPVISKPPGFGDDEG